MSHWEATPVHDELVNGVDGPTGDVFDPIEVVETLTAQPSAVAALVWLAFAIVLLVTPAIVWASYKAAF